MTSGKTSAKSPRPSYAPREPASLKEATDALVKACGGYDEAAKRVRVGKTALQRYSAPEERDYYIPADVIRALELHCADPIVTRFLAAEQGCHLSCERYDPTPERFSDDMGRLADDVAARTKDGAKALAEGADRPGQLSPKTTGRLVRDIDRMAAVLFHMRGRLRAFSGGGV